MASSIVRIECYHFCAKSGMPEIGDTLKSTLNAEVRERTEREIKKAGDVGVKQVSVRCGARSTH